MFSLIQVECVCVYVCLCFFPFVPGNVKVVIGSLLLCFFFSLLFVSLKYIFTRYTEMHIFRSHELYLFCILKLVNIIVAAHIRVVFSFESFLKLCTKIKDFVVEILFTPLNRKPSVRAVCVCVAWPIICYFPRNWNQQGGKYTKYLYICIYTVNKNPNNTISTFVWLNGCFCSSWFRFLSRSVLNSHSQFVYFYFAIISVAILRERFQKCLIEAL